MKDIRLNRRTFLRGLGGISIALPTLEIMLDGQLAHAQAAPAKRIGVFFVGQSLGADGDRRNFFVPPSAGANYVTSVGLRPLETRNVKSDVSVVSGLYIPTGSGPGNRGPEYHPYAHWPMLNGTCNIASSGAREGDNIGESADQIIGRTLGANTRFLSLNYQGQPNFYLPGYDFYGRDIMAFKRNSNGSISRISNQTSPHAAFLSLFGSFTPPGGNVDPVVAAELVKRRSILDAVLNDRNRLLNLLGVSDQQRLTQHLDEIRSLESRISHSIPPPSMSACSKPSDPGVDPSINIAARYSNERERNLIFMDLIHMAFVCDLTRAATLMLTTSQCHMSALSVNSSFSNITDGCEPHEIGHNAGGAPRQAPAGTPVTIMNPNLSASDSNSYAMSLIHAWHVDQFAYLVAKLKSTAEGTGTLLDSSALLLVFEGGHGRLLNSPGDTGAAIGTHSTENMAMLVAGRAGGLKPGKHIVKNGVHPALVTISAMKAVGHNSETLGQMQGTVPELFT